MDGLNYGLLVTVAEMLEARHFFEAPFTLDSRTIYESYGALMPDGMAATSDLLFFLSKRDLFYNDRVNGWQQVDLKTRITHHLDISDNESTNIAFDGQQIYYLDEKSALQCYAVSERTTGRVSDFVAKDFFFTNSGIYYLNLRDRNTIYFYDFLSKSSCKLTDIPAYTVQIQNQQIRFLSQQDSKAYQADIDGRNVCVVNES